MKRIIIFIIASIIVISMYAQELKIVEVIGNYSYNIPEHQSIEHAKKYVLELAKIDAINQALGVRVQQESVLVTVEDGTNVKQKYKVHQETVVRGDWIETIGEPQYIVTHEKEDGEFVGLKINVKVRGKVREIPDNRRPFILRVLRKHQVYNTMGNPWRYEETNRFKEEDMLVLDFKSDVKGYVAIFIREDDYVFQIQPHEGDYSCIGVKGGCEYRFLEKYNGEGIPVVLARYKETVNYQLIVVFSVQPFDLGLKYPPYKTSSPFLMTNDFNTNLEKLVKARLEAQVHKKWMLVTDAPKFATTYYDKYLNEPDEIW